MRLGIQVGASLVRGGYLSLGEALALLHSTPFRGCLLYTSDAADE